eukprot:2635038-Pyramimonas_sp.AAC.1
MEARNRAQASCSTTPLRSTSAQGAVGRARVGRNSKDVSHRGPEKGRRGGGLCNRGARLTEERA